MKFFYLACFAVLFCLTPFLSKADILIQEEFTNTTSFNPPGWSYTNHQGSEDWDLRDTPAFGSASAGGYAVFDDFSFGPATTPNEASLSTLSVDCSNRQKIFLTYSHHWFGVEFTHGYIEVSSDGGTNFTPVFDYHTVTRGSLAAPQDTTLDLTTWAAGQADVQVRFRYTDGGQTGQFWYIDDVILHTGPDVEIIKIDPDFLTCDYTFTTTEPVTLRIYNHDIAPIGNVPVYFNVSGGTSNSFSEVFPGIIPPFSYADHTFASTIDMSADALYLFEAYTGLTIDNYILNDTFLASRRPKIVRTALPLYQNFDTNQAAWEVIPGQNSTFINGPLPYLNGAEGFGNCFYSEGFNGSDVLHIQSPLFDFSQTTDPYVSFDIKFDLEYGGLAYQRQNAYMQYSLDLGATWTLLGYDDDPNWYPALNRDVFGYGLQDSWKPVYTSLCELSGEHCVQFRVSLTYGSNNGKAKFAFDNFRVTDGTGDDLEPMLFFPSGTGDCTGFPATEALGITIRNNECRPITNLQVQVDVTGPNPVSFVETIPGPIPPFQYSNHILDTTLDMSSQGMYTIQATVLDNLLGDTTDYYQDTALFNNTLIETRYNGPITTFPYEADFNTSNQGWASEGIHPDFVLVRDTLPIMGGHEGNGKSWYLDREDLNRGTWVESPIFDLSNLTNPNLFIDVKYIIAGTSWQYNTDLEWSTDGGSSWNRMARWCCNTDTTWTTKQYSLCDLKSSCIKFRLDCYFFGAERSFAFDNFVISDKPDASIQKIIAPKDEGCLFSQQQEVTVAIYNWGCVPINNIPVEYSVTGPSNATFQGIVPGPILPQDTVHYTFTGTYDMTPIGVYELTTLINGFDTNLRNDTLRETYDVNRPKIISFPFFEDFESNDGFWVDTSETPTSQFHWGPVPYLNGPEGNGNSWYTQASGSDWVVLESPVFDFTKVTEPYVHFDTKFQLNRDPYYGPRVQYSVDGGSSWSILGEPVDSVWYNALGYFWNGSQPTWKRMSHSLCDVSGESCVILRIYGDFRGEEFALDNFEITDGTGDDLEPMQLYLPNGGNCTGYSSSEMPGISIRNNQCRPLTNVPIALTKYGVDTITIVDTIPGPIPRLGYYYHEFDQSIDMAPSEEYWIDVEVFSNPTGEGLSCINDTFPGNNILSENRFSNPIDSFPYLADFESHNYGWASNVTDTYSQFVRDTIPSDYMNGSEGMGKSFYFYDERDQYAYVTKWVESPQFNLSVMTDPQLLMDIKFQQECGNYNHSGIVEYKTETVGWTNLGTGNDPNWYNSSSRWQGIGTTWHKVQHSLCEIKTETCVKFRILVRRYCATENRKFAFDNFEIQDAPDVAPAVLVEPLDEGCLFSDSQQIKVAVYNYSCTDLVDIPVSCIVSGMANITLSGIMPGPIVSGDTAHYIIPGTFDMTPLGRYQFATTTNLAEDSINYNNTIQDSILVSLPKITTFPYQTDFNTADEQWAPQGGVPGREWKWDTINVAGASDGYGNGWIAINENGFQQYGLPTFQLETPVFDFSFLTNPYVTLDVKHQLGSSVVHQMNVRMQYSIDGGDTWVTLGDNTDPHWYDGGYWAYNRPWTKQSLSLCQLAGEPCVKLRYNARFIGDGYFALDNFLIGDIEDIAPLSFLSPVQKGCSYLASDTVKVELYNWSCSTLYNVPVSFNLSGQTIQSATEIIDSLPPTSYSEFTFTNTIDLTQIGTYYLEVFTDQQTEVIRRNDTIRTQVVVDHITVSGSNYFENFDTTSGYGNWVVRGNDADKDILWGIVPYQGGAEDNGNSWYTLYTGSRNTLLLESPIFDFSNAINPELFLELKMNLTGPAEATIEYTIDGGSTWEELGSSSDPNWYNSSSGWDGTLANWTLFNHDLCPLIGESCVIFRVNIYSSWGYGSGQFAIDNWHLSDSEIDIVSETMYSCSGSEYELELTITNRELACIPTPILNDLEVGYSIDGGAPITQSYAGLTIAGDSTTTLIVSNITIPNVNSEVKVWVYNPNSLNDFIFENDTLFLTADQWPDCNDHCSNAYQLAIGTTTTSQTSNATIEPTEDPLFTNCGPITIENTVWYSFQTNASGGIVTAGFENIVCSPSTNGIQVSIDALNGPACAGSSLTNIYCNSPGDTNPFQFGPAVLPGNTTYYITVDGFAGNSCDFDIVLSGAIQGPECIPVAINAILEGPYDISTGLMTDELRVLGVIPTSEPFTGYGFAHIGSGGGEVVDPIVFDVAGPDAIIDWVFLELRDQADSSLVLATRSALLQADGDVVDIDGIFPVQFCGLSEGNYYVAIRPRHHLATMTKSAIPLLRTVVNIYDFRTGNTYVDNVNSTPQKLMSDGNWVLYEGDLSADFEINALDRSLAWNARNLAGYLQDDSNMDGVCDAADRSQVWNNRNITAHIPR